MVLMARRSKVHLYKEIREARERGRLSIRGLARCFGVRQRPVCEAPASPRCHRRTTWRSVPGEAVSTRLKCS